MNESLTLLLRQMRGQTGLNVRDAAARVGIDPSKLSRYESGQRVPTQADLIKLSTGYDLSADDSDRLYVLTGRVPPGWSIEHRRTLATTRPPTLGRRARRPLSRPQIETTAYNLIEAFRTKDPKVWNRPPIPFERIAGELLELRIRIMPLSQLDSRMLGALDREARSILIDEAVRDSAMYSFTVCHEIGHWCLHEQATRSSGCTPISDSSRRGEREADQFAAALLLPAPMVAAELRLIGDGPSTDERARLLAARFGTSTEAARIRLREL